MALSITSERFSAIRAKIMRRKSEALVAEITAIDWNNQAHFQNVDEFLRYADTFIEQSEADPQGHGSVGGPRRRGVMHLLLILVILMLAFPAFSRFIGGCLSVVFWLFFACVVLAVFGALPH